MAAELDLATRRREGALGKTGCRPPSPGLRSPQLWAHWHRLPSPGLLGSPQATWLAAAARPPATFQPHPHWSSLRPSSRGQCSRRFIRRLGQQLPYLLPRQAPASKVSVLLGLSHWEYSFLLLGRYGCTVLFCSFLCPLVSGRGLLLVSWHWVFSRHRGRQCHVGVGIMGTGFTFLALVCHISRTAGQSLGPFEPQVTHL